MRPRSIKISSVDLGLMLLICTVFSFFRGSLYSLVRYAITLYLLMKYRAYMTMNPLVSILLMAYGVLLGLSSYLNTDSLTWGLSGLFHALCLICIYVTLSGVAAKRGPRDMYRVLLSAFGLLLLLTDTLILLYPYEITSQTVYLIGDKFHVSYMHCLFFTMVCLGAEHLKKKPWLFLAGSVSLAAVLKIRCTTGAIMLLLCICVEILSTAIPPTRKLICSVVGVMISLLAINVLIWGPEEFLRTPWAGHVIEDVLGKSSNMTGRFKLYGLVPDLVSSKPWLGFGFQTDIFRVMVGYGNAQNGLMQIVIESGVIGAALYFFAVFLLVGKHSGDTRLYPLFGYLYAFVVGSISEMNLSTYFVLGAVLLYVFGETSCALLGHGRETSYMLHRTKVGGQHRDERRCEWQYTAREYFLARKK